VLRNGTATAVSPYCYLQVSEEHVAVGLRNGDIRWQTFLLWSAPSHSSRCALSMCGRLTSWRARSVGAEAIVLLVIAGAVLGYLVWALLNPERL